jgi:hypothetical protein
LAHSAGTVFRGAKPACSRDSCHSNEGKKTPAAAKPASLPPARRIKKNARQAAYRERQRKGEFIAAVPIDAAILGFLTRARWLDEADAGWPQKIAEAVRSLLELSAKI